MLGVPFVCPAGHWANESRSALACVALDLDARRVPKKLLAHLRPGSHTVPPASLFGLFKARLLEPHLP